MTRDELTTLVREIVADRLRHRAAPPALPPTPAATHPSHGIYVSIVNADNACVIEPSATCDHCGYCKSHGH
jgi:hypothetical protein